MRVPKLLVLVFLSFVGLSFAQSSPVPQEMRFSSTIPNRESARTQYSIRFAIFANGQGGEPLWSEEQIVTVSPAGAFTVLLGTGSSALPSSIFSTGEARWIATIVEGQEVGPRALLVSVPYAMKAADADTFAGRSVTEFVTHAQLSDYYQRTPSAIEVQSLPLQNKTALTANVTSFATASGNGTAGFIPAWLDSAGTLTNSALFQSPTGNLLGIGTTAPAYNLHVISDTDPAAITVEGYGTVGINFIGRRAQGTPTSPQPLRLNDNIMTMQGRGFGTTAFSPVSRAYMKFFAAENWSDTAQGTYIALATTTKGTAPNFSATERLRIDDSGNVGIGTASPSQRLEVQGNIKITGGGLVFGDGSVQSSALAGVTAADTSLTIANNQARVSNSGITSIHLADGSVTASKLDPALAANIVSTATLSTNIFSGPQTINVSDPLGFGLSTQNSAATGTATAITAESVSSAGRAIYGYASNTGSTSTGRGVHGATNAGKGTGVYGEAVSTSGLNYGVWGVSRSSTGIGIYGQALSATTSGVNKTKGVYGVVAGENGSAGVSGEASNTTAQSLTYGVYGIARGSQGIGVYGEADTTVSTGQPAGLVGVARSSTGYAAQFFKYSNSGNVIAAYSAPTSASTPTLIMRLDGVGNLRTAGAVSGNGADFAEMVEASASSRRLEPGDVVVISEEADRRVELSSEPYSTKVIGIYSTKPGVIGRPNALTDSSDHEIPVAMIGIVPCKATAENGSIHRGDLLVTSSISGYVMKATDRTRLAGAVVGKAMQSLESGTGTIEIALTLQ